MTKSKIILTLVATLVITSCGSGGNNTTQTSVSTSSSTSGTTPTILSSEEPKTISPTTAKTPNGITIELSSKNENHINNQDPFVGAGFSTPKQPGEVLIVKRHNSVGNESDLRTLHIDGKKFDIFPSTTAKNISMKGQNMERIALQGENITIGILSDADTPHYMFFNAINPTQNTEHLKGVFSYSGTGYHAHATDGSKNPNIVDDSVVKLTADFNDKFIAGTISSPNNDFKSIEIGGYITNNAFQGKVDKTELKGGFFGNQAQEAAGYYTNLDESNPSYGVFKATKQ